MELHAIDVAIIVGYLVVIIVTGAVLSKWASRNLSSYFLGGRSLPWYIIGTSHGASGFDITGTMWFVAMVFTFGLKAAWIPWIWPLFDRVFRQVYLGPWIRRSNVLTGAEWMRTRFGSGRGGDLAHISVVVYAMVATIVFLGYAFKGIGKFADVLFQKSLAWGPFSSADSYAIIILFLTTSYLLLGGWYSVVLTDLIQFVLLTIACVFVAIVALDTVTPEALAQATPAGWTNLFPDVTLDLDWTGLVDQLNDQILESGYSFFGVIIMIMLLRGLLVSMAGPTPGYGMQHVLSTRSPREAALENWWMSIVQLVPRFLMITGIAVIALVYFQPLVGQIIEEEKKFDVERILPHVIEQGFLPVGLVGILLAGLLAAFMSTFDSTVNAGAAYVVNDVYKRYIRPDAPPKRYIHMSYLVCLVLVVIAIALGMQMRSIDSVTKWITFVLYGGYVAPNILKWHWWRFNGYGYFAGMIAGVVVALVAAVVRALEPSIRAIHTLPFTLLASIVASIYVCRRTPPEPDGVLERFYLSVRPWGWWAPVHKKLLAKYPDLERNRDAWWDAFNIANGIIWQVTLMVIPICIVIRQYTTLWLSCAVCAVTSIIMKFTWYDRLGPGDMYLPEGVEERAR